MMLEGRKGPEGRKEKEAWRGGKSQREEGEEPREWK